MLATLKTWPVTGGERGRLIEKEQFRVPSTPDVMMPTFELRDATDPLPRRPAASGKRLRISMKSAAAISHEEAACVRGEELAEWIDTIL
jgi:hypothetical protein